MRLGRTVGGALHPNGYCEPDDLSRPGVDDEYSSPSGHHDDDRADKLDGNIDHRFRADGRRDRHGWQR